MSEESVPVNNENESIDRETKLEIVVTLAIHIYNLGVLLDNLPFEKGRYVIEHSIDQLDKISALLMQEFGISIDEVLECMRKSREDNRLSIVEENLPEHDMMYW